MESFLDRAQIGDTKEEQTFQAGHIACVQAWTAELG